MKITATCFFLFSCNPIVVAAEPPKEADKTPAPGAEEKPVVEEKWSGNEINVRTVEKSVEVDSNAKDEITFRFGSISDSGVELERAAGGVVICRVHVRHLGVDHSKYNHEANVRVEGGEVLVTSLGADTIHEVRDLKTGRQISRKIESRYKQEADGKPVLEERWLEPADGHVLKGEFLETDDRGEDRISFRYHPKLDRGVELERTVNNRVLWRVHLQPVGLKRSKYSQTVRVHLAGSRLYVTTQGAKTIVESRDLETGQQLYREARAR